MELTMTNGFSELSFDDLFDIEGGVNWDKVFWGVSIVGATCIAIACAPAAAFVGVAYGCMLVAALVVVQQLDIILVRVLESKVFNNETGI